MFWTKHYSAQKNEFDDELYLEKDQLTEADASLVAFRR